MAGSRYRIQLMRAVFLLLMSCLWLSNLHGQSVVTTSGKNAKASEGSVSFTVGQVMYSTYSTTEANVAEGIQQPFEISVITSNGIPENINLAYRVYPNPTRGQVTLLVDHENFRKMRFRLYNSEGALLQDNPVVSHTTGLPMEYLPPAIYFLEVINDDQKIKVFKIIKN